jgi:5'-deoxynucleotidase
MQFRFYALISRMRYITRWGLMRNTFSENIAEHSHMVAVLAHALGVIRRDVFGVDCDPAEYAAVALYHDSSEILTGDLPTPIKYHSREIREAYAQIQIARRSTEQADENLRLSRNQYDAGTMSLTDLLDAVTLYTQSHSRLDTACADYQARIAEYLRKTR